MRIDAVARHGLAAWFVLIGASPCQSSAQSAAPRMTELPSSVRLSDVEIRWESGGGDGCVGECTIYRVTVQGDGLVTLEDLGWGNRPPKAPTRRRSIAVEEVVALVNEFLDARFFEAPDKLPPARCHSKRGLVVPVSQRGRWRRLGRRDSPHRTQRENNSCWRECSLRFATCARPCLGCRRSEGMVISSGPCPQLAADGGWRPA